LRQLSANEIPEPAEVERKARRQSIVESRGAARQSSRFRIAAFGLLAGDVGHEKIIAPQTTHYPAQNYSQAEIKAFLEQVLDEEPIPVAPGVLYLPG
jgi:hypothetical protein